MQILRLAIVSLMPRLFTQAGQAAWPPCNPGWHESYARGCKSTSIDVGEDVEARLQ